MKIISILLICYLFHVSVGYVLDSGSELPASDGLESEEDDQTQGEMKQNLQADPDPEEEDLETNGNNNDFSNQDDDDNGGNENPSEMTEPSPPIAIQPNVDQSRGLPGGVGDNLPAPDYSAVNRAYASGCHNGQYQCQKRDPIAQTRCIPQEWKCNGLRDCEENDDESGCSSHQLSRGRTQAKCTADQYQCHGSGINSVPPHCIERRHVCDGTYQCSYGDDEAECQRRDDRRDQTHYQNQNQNQNQIPRRNENNGNTNDQNSGNRVSDSREGYRPQPQQNDRKSEEYVQRLEWRDRCFRSCLKY